jgi:hypothetical protein
MRLGAQGWVCTNNFLSGGQAVYKLAYLRMGAEMALGPCILRSRDPDAQAQALPDAASECTSRAESRVRILDHPRQHLALLLGERVGELVEQQQAECRGLRWGMALHAFEHEGEQLGLRIHQTVPPRNS